MFRVVTLSIFIAAGLMAAATPVSAQLRIEINRGVEDPIPIAIVPFGGGESLPLQISDVIESDLGNSGWFSPLPESLMVSKPTRGEDVAFNDWRLLEVDAVVVGRIEPGANDYRITFEVFDIVRGQRVARFSLQSSPNRLRSTAHRISDKVFEELTGIPGVFSTQIAYVSVSRSAGQTRHRLIVADSDGENSRVVVESPDPLMSPAWSPDGRRIAYVSFEDNRSSIFIQTLRDGSRQRVSSRPGINGAPSFSPDGRKLVLTLSQDTGNPDVYVLNLANQVLTRLTRDPGIDTEAAWSPDGESIYFTSDRSGGPQVYRVPAAGGRAPQRVTFEGNYNARPRLTPDGKQVALVHNDRGNYRIGIVDLGRRTLQVLTDGRLDESPSIAPNGAEIIYATRSRGEGVLASISSDGRISRRIAAVAGEVREPVWGPLPLY